MIGLGRRLKPGGTPEASDPVGRLATKHALGPQIHGGTRIEHEVKELGVILGRGRRRQLQKEREARLLGTRSLGERGERSEELHQPRAGVGFPRSGRRYAVGEGFSGRRSQ